MKIHNVRLGLATNSSSSHSLIFLPKTADVPPETPGAYGWDNFTLASSQAKMGYLATALYTNMLQVASADVAAAVVSAWTGTPVERDVDENTPYIDHESLWDLPRDWSGKGVDMQFFEALKKFVMQDGLVILGGNDNDEGEECHPLAAMPGVFRLPVERDAHLPWVARFDAAHAYWSLFNRKTGAKIRMTFDEGKAIQPTKATAPELVDVKITDHCAFGCPYCYQSSVVGGQHAESVNVWAWANALAMLKVFEVALGGGEPTTHPDFPQILKTFADVGVVPNFTTRTCDWMYVPRTAAAVKEHVGAFALSITKAAQVENLLQTLATCGFDKDRMVYGNRVTVQVIHGLVDKYEFKNMLEACSTHGLRCTVLGYKAVGRGANVKPPYEFSWIDVLKSLGDKAPRVSVDTALAAACSGELDKAGVPSWCYHVAEGKFSAYLDAVRGLLMPSSYAEHPGVPVKPTAESILEAFARF